MKESPETIVLKRLPPEHVLRKGVDLLLESDDDYLFDTVRGLEGTIVADVPSRYLACYCRAEDWPAEYDDPPAPSIDPGEGWRLLEKDELVEDGDQFYCEGEWTDSANWSTLSCKAQSAFPYRRRIQPEPKPLQIEEGKRYVRRDGEVTQAIERTPRSHRYSGSHPLRDSEHGWTYRVDGSFDSKEGELHDFDLIAEYVEPEPAADDESHNAAVAIITRMSDQSTELTALRQQCQRHAERIAELEQRNGELTKLVNKCNAERASMWEDHLREVDGLKYKFDELQRDSEELNTQVHMLKNLNASWKQMIQDRDNRLQVEQMNTETQSNLIDVLRDHIKKLESNQHTLRWERRQPTEEECRERWYLTREKGGWITSWEPGEKCDNKWGPAIETYVFPNNPEPEPQTITQRRWLCKRGHGLTDWFEQWLPDGIAPDTLMWVEVIESDLTREVQS